MDFIRFAIHKPVTVCVGVILVVMFGFLGITGLPVQLTPDVESPQITVTTTWPGATPYEVEKDIVEEQEAALKGVQRLTLMEGSAFNSMAIITLTFEVGTDLNDALLNVSNKLDEVPSYPENVDRPIIEASGAESSPVIWMVLKMREGPPEKISTFRTYFENEVRQYLDRVQGVGSLFVFGGAEQQLEVVISPERLAQHRLTIANVVDRLQAANQDISAGILGLEKKNYRVRTVSQFQNPQDPLDIVISDDGLRRVYLRDVADARIGYATQTGAMMHDHVPTIVVGVRKQQGANVIDLTRRMYAAVERLNQDILEPNDLKLQIVYKQTPYIDNAMNLVKRNVFIGGSLALVVLLLFLRSISSTLVTAVAIPISAVGTFMFLWLFDRSLNVVSLAGISFAVGMLVDNAIVVLENIDRHRDMGKSPFAAAYEGAKEVWGAVLASTATTVAVFLPVIFMQEEAGQLFKDIAIAITFAIMLSLVVSVSVIPSMSHLLYRWRGENSKKVSLSGVGKAGTAMAEMILTISRLSIRNWKTRTATVGLLTFGALAVVWLLMPKAEYLPQGNRNLIINFMIPPPGYSFEKRKAIGEYIFKATRPYFEQDGKDGFPQIETIFYVAADRFTLFGGLSRHETRARELIPLFMRVMNSLPGIMGFSLQVGIFQEGLGRGRNVDVIIAGEQIDKIIGATWMLRGAITQKMPGANVRPDPSPENSYPEANFIPDRSKLLANGLNEYNLGLAVDVIMDGRKIGEFKPEQAKKIDLVLRSDQSDIKVPEDVARSVIANSYGQLIRIGDVATIQYDQGLTQIYHLERKRSIKLIVTPTLEMPLQTAMEVIQNEVLAPLRQAGKLDGLQVSTGGSADKLLEARDAIAWNLVLAAAIIYLLMSALFENFLYPLIIMFSVPLAAAGGFIGLRLVDLLVARQQFDIVTMLGFIILIGTVVNNAILIVHQALNNVREYGLEGQKAVLESVRTRIRPIFMSASTSVFALLPLAISTGQGSELYRGLGSVILGGLAISTVFTLFVVPALLSFFIHREKPRKPQESSVFE
ncbi:MAG: efflux RND transporter permease subunit [Desulfobacteraceae bacterium]|jgi:HAE1 family hydrophobic/amphiphilic exporter-1